MVRCALVTRTYAPSPQHCLLPSDCKATLQKRDGPMASRVEKCRQTTRRQSGKNQMTQRCALQSFSAEHQANLTSPARSHVLPRHARQSAGCDCKGVDKPHSARRDSTVFIALSFLNSLCRPPVCSTHRFDVSPFEECRTATGPQSMYDVRKACGTIAKRSSSF